MEALSDLQDDKAGEHITSMSSAMCAFLVINISSIQLIPITVIAYRAQYGSINPAGIIIPGIIATSVSTLAGIIFVKIMERKIKLYIKTTDNGIMMEKMLMNNRRKSYENFIL